MTHHHQASTALNLGITVVELFGGLWAGSLALLADVAHNLADVGTLGSGYLRAQVGPATIHAAAHI